MLNSQTGMLGLPEQTSGGIVVRCLLNPSIKPGRLIKVDQASIQQAKVGADLSSQAQKSFIPTTAADGIYKVLFVSHRGDTRGDLWETEIVCIVPGGVDPMSVTQTNQLTPAARLDAARAAGA